MKAILTADIHGLYSGWQKITRLLNKDDILVIAGDLYDSKYGDRQNPDFQPEKIISEFDNLTNEKHFVYGNCDLPQSYPGQNKQDLFKVFGRSIFLTHGDDLGTQPEIVKTEKHPNIYVSGHTHIFSLRGYQNMLILNPGSPSKPKTANSTYGVVEKLTDSIRVSIVDIQSDEELVAIAIT